MASKTIDELKSLVDGGTKIDIRDNTNMLFAAQYNGAVYKVSGAEFFEEIAKGMEGHGGILSFEKTGSEGLIDTYTITYADGDVSTFKVSNGKGVSSITTSFAVSTSRTTAPSDWAENVPSTWSPSIPYLWAKQTYLYNDDETDELTYVCAKYGPGISSLTETAREDKKYTDYTFTMTEGEPKTFRVYDGVGIEDIAKTGTSGLVDTYTIKYINGDTQTFEVTNGAKGEQGDKGDKGDKGADGISSTITSTTVTYQASSSGTTPPTGEWLSSPPEVAEGQYLWTKSYVLYSNGASYTAYSVGYHGEKGEQGDKGDQGVQGIQGEKGDKGDQGIQGEKGDKGDKGDQGVQGIQGEKGDQGIQGIQGEKGDQGIQGIQGEKGDQGEKGEKGDSGVYVGTGTLPEGTKVWVNPDGEADTVYPNAGAHNAIFRGKNLGTAVTDAQYTAIGAGTFDDMFIGDYWVINNVTWRIAAFDYYLTTGNTECTTHHVTIVPDTVLYNAVMNTSDTAAGGYVGSAMWKSNLATAKTMINTAFGSTHILTHRLYLCNEVTDGAPSNRSWYDSTVELMTEQNVYGCKIFAPMGDGVKIPASGMNNYEVDKSQYPLFAHDPHMISNRQWFWLRDVVTGTRFASVNNTGEANYSIPSSSGGVRPAFCIKK